jgi:hypothetical protein
MRICHFQESIAFWVRSGLHSGQKWSALGITEGQRASKIHMFHEDRRAAKSFWPSGRNPPFGSTWR